MKRILLIAIIATAWSSVFAQQEAMYTHYMYNTLAVNPAYAGTRDAMTFTALHRSQWVGFEGAPTTQTFTMHTPLRNKKIGIGISVINDVIGPDRNTGFYVDYSYKLRINKKAQLGLGLKAGLSLLKSSLSSLDLDDSNDPVFNNDVASKLLPNFGFGAYYFTDKWYVGFSIPRLLENNYSDNSIEGSANVFGDGKHYYIIGGANFKIADKIDFRPVSLIKINAGAPMEIDLTAMFVYDNKFSLGIMGRSGDAIGILASIMVLEQLEVGYSFDWSFINSTKVYNAGSHEIFLRYDLVFKNEARIHSPRYF